MALQAATAPWRFFSGLGLLIGSLFFAASLTPSLVPRGWLLQGVLGGVSFAIGYGVGVFLLWLWEFLGLPIPSERIRRSATWIAAGVATVIVLSFLWQAAGWQNTIRENMGMPPVDTAHPVKVALTALVAAIVLILLGRLFRIVFRFVSDWLERFIPPHVARVVGIAIAIVLFALVINGVLLRTVLHAADASFKRMDALVEPGTSPPTDPNKPGSSASLIDWKDLGYAGRDFVSSAPSRDEMEEFFGGDVLDPIRVYVGLNSGDSHEERAELALQELIRVGGFERAVLVVAVPTGTGWMDPAAMDTLEYLHRGDVATVAIQYSYLTSFLALLVEPEYASASGRALFNAIYDYWRELPETSRPRLYIYGISLGAIGSQQSARLYRVLGDPIQGALWVGPPFPSRTWRTVTAERDPSSPVWRPRFEDGSLVRFTNDGEELGFDGADWGPMRIVYLQHTSDPIVFGDPWAMISRPEWMDDPRGSDVTPDLRWYPFVTALQLMVDMVVGLQVPMGHGHLYSYADHIKPWIEVTEPEGWTEEEIERLKQKLKPDME